MIRKLLAFAAALAFPAIVAAQTAPQLPDRASDTAQVKVARHWQNPQVPAAESSDTAKSKVAQHRATHFRGEVVTPQTGKPSWVAIPSTGATPAKTQPGVGVVSPAVPAMPAMPATPPGKPANPGQSGNHRP
jgi:hypothetical protein